MKKNNMSQAAIINDYRTELLRFSGYTSFQRLVINNRDSGFARSAIAPRPERRTGPAPGMMPAPDANLRVCVVRYF